MEDNTLRYQNYRLSFKFANAVYPSKGSIPLVMSTPCGAKIRFLCDIVDADVPLIIGLEVMTKNHMKIDIGEDKLNIP